MQPQNLLSPVLALLTACASPALVTGADNPPTPQQTAADHAQDNSTSRPPMITRNADGTMTVRKAAARDGKGLVIPAQVVVPIIPSREKK